MDDTLLEAVEEHRHVDTLDGGQIPDVVVDQVSETMEVLAPLGRSQRRPSGECVDGGRCGCIRRESVATCDLGQLPVPIEGGTRLESSIRRDPLPSDVVIGGDCYVRDF